MSQIDSKPKIANCAGQRISNNKTCISPVPSMGLIDTPNYALLWARKLKMSTSINYHRTKVLTKLQAFEHRQFVWQLDGVRLYGRIPYK